jgi:hypothetical protein
MIVTVTQLLNNDIVRVLEEKQSRDACVVQLRENVEWRVFYPAGLKPSDYSFVDFKTTECPVDKTKQIAHIRYMLDEVPQALKNRNDIIIGEQQ